MMFLLKALQCHPVFWNPKKKKKKLQHISSRTEVLQKLLPSNNYSFIASCHYSVPENHKTELPWFPFFCSTGMLWAGKSLSCHSLRMATPANVFFWLNSCSHHLPLLGMGLSMVTQGNRGFSRMASSLRSSHSGITTVLCVSPLPEGRGPYLIHLGIPNVWYIVISHQMFLYN